MSEGARELHEQHSENSQEPDEFGAMPTLTKAQSRHLKPQFKYKSVSYVCQ